MTQQKGLVPAKGLIKKHREERDWPQKELAAQAKLSIRTIQRAEEGNTTIQRDALQRIATQLGLHVADLVDAQEPKPDVWEHVRLFATQSADEICKLFSKVEKVKYRLRADPNLQQANKLARAIEILDELKYCVTFEEWLGLSEEKVPFPQQIRLRGELNQLLAELAADGFRLFIGQYIVRHLNRESCEYEGAYVSTITPEMQSNCMVVISTEEARSIHEQYAGMSEFDLFFAIRTALKAGAKITDWPYWLREFRKRLENEIGEKVEAWNERGEEVPW